MSSSLSDRACILRDRLTDAYIYTRSQFGEESKTAQTVDALYASFFALREHLSTSADSSEKVTNWYAPRKIPICDLSETFCRGKRPMCFTEEQRMHLIATCHQLSTFLEEVQVANKEESARIFRRMNRRIRATRKLVKLNTARILF